MTVHNGPYKGKPAKLLPRHLAQSYRPMDVQSAHSGTLCGIASERLATNMEIQGAYTPLVFSYRTRHNAQFQVLVGPAPIYRTLLEHRPCAPGHVLTLALGVNWSTAVPLQLPGRRHTYPPPSWCTTTTAGTYTPPYKASRHNRTHAATRRDGRDASCTRKSWSSSTCASYATASRKTGPRSPILRTSRPPTPPELVGVPLLPELALHKATNKALRALRSVHKGIARGPASPILCLGTVYSFGLSAFNYLSGGVLVGATDLRTHERITDTVHLTAYYLPPWTHRSLLRLDLAPGGFGSPDLSDPCYSPSSPTSAPRGEPNG